MLRSFEQIRHPANLDRLIAADDEFATLSGSGAYAMPWHWHDCLMFILPSHGTVELKHEDRRDGSWLSQDRFAVVPPVDPHAEVVIAKFSSQPQPTDAEAKVSNLALFQAITDTLR